MRQGIQTKEARGSVLVLALVFLLVVGVLGMTGMENAVLELRMVTGTSIQEAVLSNAEQGLKLAEQAIIAAVDDGYPLDIRERDIFYPVEGAGAIDPVFADWSTIPLTGSDSARGIEYVIQYAGQVSIAAAEGAGNSLLMGSQETTDAGMAHLFLITSRAELNGHMRLVQSVYLSASAP
ncbi:MAG: hypothetical protein PVF16_04120 [Chromatiales bacterium]|jgi:hypothetical protein